MSILAARIPNLTVSFVFSNPDGARLFV